MKKYKGYYIDGTHFTCKQDIDKFLEKQAVESYENALLIFSMRMNMEASLFVVEKEEYLHNQFGYDWETIENIQIEFFKSLAETRVA